MRDHTIWSISIGRWNGLNVRVHMFFLLFAVVTLYLGWRDVATAQADHQVWLGLAALGILFASVVIHEIGHLIVANRMGASTDELVLGPLGGLGPQPTPLETHGELVVATAGPLANLGVCFAAAFCLAVQGGVQLIGLMNPFAPTDITVGAPVEVLVKLTFWINWLLILANLIPAYPFDGGRALRALFMLTNVNMDHHRAVLTVARVAKFSAVLLLIIAWLNLGANNASLQTWFALALLSIFVYFSAKKEAARGASPQSEDAFLGYDFSAGYTSLEQSGSQLSATKRNPPNPSPWVRWWRRRKEKQEQRRREIEVLEDGRVDDILLQVHESGMDSLSQEDRDLLTRVSQRYRKRL